MGEEEEAVADGMLTLASIPDHGIKRQTQMRELKIYLLGRDTSNHREGSQEEVIHHRGEVVHLQGHVTITGLVKVMTDGV